MVTRKRPSLRPFPLPAPVSVGSVCLRFRGGTAQRLPTSQSCTGWAALLHVAGDAMLPLQSVCTEDSVLCSALCLCLGGLLLDNQDGTDCSSSGVDDRRLSDGKRRIQAGRSPLLSLCPSRQSWRVKNSQVEQGYVIFHEVGGRTELGTSEPRSTSNQSHSCLGRCQYRATSTEVRRYNFKLSKDCTAHSTTTTRLGAAPPILPSSPPLASTSQPSINHHGISCWPVAKHSHATPEIHPPLSSPFGWSRSIQRTPTSDPHQKVHRPREQVSYSSHRLVTCKPQERPVRLACTSV